MHTYTHTYIHTYIYTYIKRKDMFYLTTHSTRFIYGFVSSDIWYESERKPAAATWATLSD